MSWLKCELFLKVTRFSLCVLGGVYQSGILKGLDCLPASSSLVATSRVLCISQSTLRISEMQPHFRFLLLGEVLLGCTKYQKPTQTKQNSCGGNLERVSLPLCWGFHPWRVRWGGMGSFLSGHGTSGKEHDVPTIMHKYSHRWRLSSSHSSTRGFRPSSGMFLEMFKCDVQVLCLVAETTRVLPTLHSGLCHSWLHLPVRVLNMVVFCTPAGLNISEHLGSSTAELR